MRWQTVGKGAGAVAYHVEFQYVLVPSSLLRSISRNLSDANNPNSVGMELVMTFDAGRSQHKKMRTVRKERDSNNNRYKSCGYVQVNNSSRCESWPN